MIPVFGGADKEGGHSGGGASRGEWRERRRLWWVCALWAWWIDILCDFFAERLGLMQSSVVDALDGD